MVQEGRLATDGKCCLKDHPCASIASGRVKRRRGEKVECHVGPGTRGILGTGVGGG